MDRIKSEVTAGLVSIVIPTHNRSDMICETLDSIKNQTYKNVEVIIVDDHSEDNTVRTIKDYIKKNTETSIRLINNDGFGACAARNLGVKTSSGEYIQFFDDDDLMSTNHIEKKVKTIQEGKYDYVSCNFSYFDDKTKSCVGHKDISSIKHNCPVHLLSKAFPTPCFMCTRSAICAMGEWNESIKKMQDMAYFHRLFLLDLKGFYLKDELFDVRIHDRSMTANNVKKASGCYAQYEALDSIKKEWAMLERKKREPILDAILFLKYTIGRNLYNLGFRRKGCLLTLNTFVNNFLRSLGLVHLLIKYKTIHITETLVSSTDI